jgi:hypothetical protein
MGIKPRTKQHWRANARPCTHMHAYSFNKFTKGGGRAGHLVQGVIGLSVCTQQF